jgi:NAD-dependent SIR2 family protein deacetylase
MRVYFLGAGASKSFYNKLPTASQLTFERLIEPSSYENGEAPSDAIAALRSFAESRKLSVEQRTQPIEEILDIFEGNRHEYRSLQFCLCRRLRVSVDSGTSRLANWLMGIRKNGAVLITTNYDTLLEHGISKLTQVPDSRPQRERGLLNYGVDRARLMPNYQALARDSSPRSITILKLHGSIGWSYCESCGKGRLDPLYRDEATNALAGETCKCEGDLSPILVGPARKQYDHPVIADVVSTAREVLRQAGKIVFAGFSMNDGDEKVAELLSRAHAEAHTGCVVIVDNNACSLKPRYQQIYPDVDLQTYQMDWAEYLAVTSCENDRY